MVNDASVGPAGRLGEPQAAPDAFANANSLDDLGDLARKAGRP